MKHTHMSLCSTRTTWFPGALPLPHILENQNSQRKRAYSWVQSRCILTGSLFDIQLCEPWVCIQNILKRMYISKREESNPFLNRCHEVTAPSVEDLWEQRDRNDGKNQHELSGLTRFTHYVWYLMSHFFFTRTYCNNSTPYILQWTFQLSIVLDLQKTCEDSGRELSYAYSQVPNGDFWHD